MSDYADQHKRVEQGANNTNIIGLSPIWAIHVRARLNDPCGSLTTQSILLFYIPPMLRTPEVEKILQVGSHEYGVEGSPRDC